MIKNKKVSIIGAGIAGIATAISLIEKGYKVEIFESKTNIGGRAGSINSKYGVMDIGQHIILGTYKNFINILKKLNVMGKIKINKNLYIPIIDNEKKYYIKSNFPYFPFSILFAILGYKNLCLNNKHSAIKSIVSELENKGLDRCPNRGIKSHQKYIGLAICAFNFKKIGRQIFELQKIKQQ